ncbi:TPA: hypothetical protein ACXDAY_002181 [Clostridium botulinum]|uniref:hypothetical protein n=1 Tax=Clostridium botulinum TaxID=1491 RepID=UPI000464E8F2|nr:hypothetical protein [Clostridium botulinum]APH20919.1 hypothetical protein NPD1_4188 [Clostridium botulinum]APQ71173.1 hypothetical protein RSJ8_4145 [Clostridium botulinum]APR02383.1 hypothetical protein RSJ2_4008 [Clostridium botulinum]AUN01534.1 hypothetical protein RSJ19_00700 [Clostridium botulinum]MBN3352114.1 hypothetical protein [Clostridium botulinum]
MNFMEQIMLMEKLSPSADEIINAYNERKESFEPVNNEMFEQHSKTILEIVSGAGIDAKYENGKVFITLD